MDQNRASEPFLSRHTVEGLVDLTRRLGMTSDLQTMLEIICRAIVEVARFDSAAINLVDDAGDLQVVAVAGPPDVGDALLGTIGSREQWDVEIATAVDHHGLLLSLAPDQAGLIASWTSPDAGWFERTASDPQAWRPEYALFVRMADASGEMIGVVSVDLPVSGLIPDAAQSATVEILARQAETAIASARLLARSELNERVYRLAFDTAPTLTAIAEPGGTFVDVNQAFADAFGDDVVDAGAFDRAVTSHGGADGLVAVLTSTFSGATAAAATFVAETGTSPASRWFRVTVRGIGQTTAVPARAVCTIVDISEERREQLRHRREAEHDPLTGLLNRRGARPAMDALVAADDDRRQVAILAADLDGFKLANDVFGHLVGDEVLIRTAARLREILPDDAAVVRLGGDEFVALLRCGELEEVRALAAAVIDGVGAGFAVGDRHVPVSISVGLATADSAGPDDIGALMDAADRALYEAKSAGRARWVEAAQPFA